MLAAVYLATSGLLSVDLSLVVELVAFLLMLWVLARFVYPPVMDVIDARQRAINAQLAAADKARKQAEEQRSQAAASVQQARQQAGQIIDGANRTGERAQQEAEEKAREEARRIADAASREIDGERQRAIQSIRRQMRDIVSSAVTKIVGASPDGDRGRELIETVIQQVEREPNVTG